MPILHQQLLHHDKRAIVRCQSSMFGINMDNISRRYAAKLCVMIPHVGPTKLSPSPYIEWPAGTQDCCVFSG